MKLLGFWIRESDNELQGFLPKLSLMPAIARDVKKYGFCVVGGTDIFLEVFK